MYPLLVNYAAAKLLNHTNEKGGGKGNNLQLHVKGYWILPLFVSSAAPWHREDFAYICGEKNNHMRISYLFPTLNKF